MAAMSSFKTVKSLSKPLLQPPVLATLLSIGVHGLFAITLPFLPANSKVKVPDSPRSVGLIELTPTEQARLPDFSIPQIILPDQPSSFVAQQPPGTKPLGSIPNCPDGQMLELSQGQCISVPGQSTLPLSPPTDPSFTNPNFPPPPPISYYPIPPVAQRVPLPPPTQRIPPQSTLILPPPKLPAGSAALITPPSGAPSSQTPATPGTAPAPDGGDNSAIAVAPRVSPPTPPPRIAALMEEQKQLREIYARETIGITSQEAYAKLDGLTEWWKKVNENPADPKSPTKTVKFPPRYPAKACTKRSKDPVKGTVRVAALISPEGKVVDDPLIVQRSNFKILNQAAGDTIADIKARSYDPIGGYQVYIFDLEFNGENCTNLS